MMQPFLRKSATVLHSNFATRLAVCSANTTDTPNPDPDRTLEHAVDFIERSFLIDVRILGRVIAIAASATGKNVAGYR
jgi:hypothetical protein